MAQRVLPLFERLEIETQSHCNRSCWFCPRVHDRSGAYLDGEGNSVTRQMATKTVLDVLDQAASLGFDGGVSFYFYSESLLDKRNLYFATEARRRGMKPYLHTNGDVLRKNEALCREVAGVYEYVVVGIYDYETEAELAAEKSFWRDRLADCDLRFSTIGGDSAAGVSSMGIPRALVPTDPRFAIPDFTFDNAPCHRPLIRLILRHDGEMCMCCEDAQSDFNLGNIRDLTLEQLWYSEKHVRMVDDLLAGRRKNFALCRNCPLPPSVSPAEGSRVILNVRDYAIPSAPAQSEAAIRLDSGTSEQSG